MTTKRPDQYDLERGSDGDSHRTSTYSRTPFRIGLFVAIVGLIVSLVAAQGRALFVWLAFFIFVGGCCFYRLYLMESASKTTKAVGYAGQPVSVHLGRLGATQDVVAHQPQYNAASTSFPEAPTEPTVPRTTVLSVLEQQAEHLERKSNALGNKTGISAELAHRRYVKAVRHIIDRADAIVGTFYSTDPGACRLATLPAKELADFLMDSALRLSCDYTQDHWNMYQTAAGIWVQYHLGKANLPSAAKETRDQAQQIVTDAMERFRQAMWNDLQKIYNEVCGARGLRRERTATAESLRIWSDRYDWYYRPRKAHLEEYETIDSRLSHIRRFIAA